MTVEQFINILPYSFAFCFSLSILIFTWIRWRVKAASQFGWFLFGQNLWLLALILRLTSTSLEVKLFWDKVEWLAAVIATISLPYFVSRYTQYKFKHENWILIPFMGIPLLFMIFLFTDPLHHLAYQSYALVQGSEFVELQVRNSLVANLMAVYCAISAVVNMVFLLGYSNRSSQLAKNQSFLIAFGVMLPIIGVVLSYLNIHLIPGRDAGPIAAVVGDLIIAWGLFRYSIFNIVPIAREHILENMEDMVLVLDAIDRVVVINKKGLTDLNQDSKQVLGRSVYEVLENLELPLDEFREPSNGTTEIYVKGTRGYYHYDVKSTLLKDKFGNYQGRIFVARDVTKYAELQWRLRELNENLEKRVAEQTKQLAESYETTLEGWAKALELRDKETEGHSRRVTEKTVELARRYGIDESQIEHIRRGAILHDIGKMAIPDEILREKRDLTVEDWEIIHKHPATAYELLKAIPFLKPAIDIPYCHHEHWDGSGYPRGLKGEEIPIAARLFSVVDVWDALLSNRTYSKAWEKEEVIEYIKGKSGKQFDPHVVEVFFKMER
jgi:putative nucleotidyltransferase with HDIG domain